MEKENKNKQIQIAGTNSKQIQINELYVFLQKTKNNELFQNLLNGNESFPLSLFDDIVTKHSSLNLDEIEKINLISIYNSSLLPWKRSYGLLLGDVYNTAFCIDPNVKVGNIFQSNIASFSAKKDTLLQNNCIFLGEAGCGKTFLLRKVCMELLKDEKHVLYLSAQDWTNKNIIFNYINYVLNGIVVPPNDLLIIIDGIDEIFATNHTELAQLISKTSMVNCYFWLGCRTDYYDSAICLDSIPYQRIYLQEWKSNQSLQYVKEYNQKLNNNILEKYLCLINQNNNIESFLKNPLRLSMLIYILENDTKDIVLHNNEYLLYNDFFAQWINNEIRRSMESNLCEESVIEEWQRIARLLYVNRYCEVSVKNSSVLISILKVTSIAVSYIKVNDFLHRSFMEFLLAKEVISSAMKSSDDIIKNLKYNNRSDVDHYIKKAFASMLPNQKSIIINNLISAYYKVEKEKCNEKDCFYVQNQIVYYLTRMYSSSPKIKSFIKEIYVQENRPIMLQGIAYGAANIGLLDIALDFAKRMDNPYSPENQTNRAWTLIFYGDQPDEDPLEYEDIYNAPWQNSKEARLRRLSGSQTKEQAFRMFDLCILHGFFESRGWNGLSSDDLKIISETETDINGFNQDIVEFLRKKKQDLINKYNEYNT